MYIYFVNILRVYRYILYTTVKSFETLLSIWNISHFLLNLKMFKITFVDNSIIMPTL